MIKPDYDWALCPCGQYHREYVIPCADALDPNTPRNRLLDPVVHQLLFSAPAEEGTPSFSRHPNFTPSVEQIEEVRVMLACDAPLNEYTNGAFDMLRWLYLGTPLPERWYKNVSEER